MGEGRREGKKVAGEGKVKELISEMTVARCMETLPFIIRKSKFYLKICPFECDLNHSP